MISEQITNDIPPQIMVIPIPMHFCACVPLKSLFHFKMGCCKPHKAMFYIMKCA